MKAPNYYGISLKTLSLGMNESMFSLTLRFSDSADYRKFIFETRLLPSRNTFFSRVMHSTARIYVWRHRTLREITLVSQGNLSDILFDLRQTIDPRKLILLDFSVQSAHTFFATTFLNALHTCIKTSRLCFEKTDDPEAFHDFRLAIRAFTSLLQIARKTGVKGLDTLTKNARFLAKSSNELRDTDVRIGLYAEFKHEIPASLIKYRETLLMNARASLHAESAQTWLTALRFIAAYPAHAKEEVHFLKYLTDQTKKVAKRWHKLDLKDDAKVHALRIRMKRLTYGYTTLKDKESDILETAKSIKAIQSRLGDIRDLRSFFILPGLDPETRYQAVQKLSSLEDEVKDMKIK